MSTARSLLTRLSAALLLLLAAGCDDLPRDPDGTLARVQGGVLRAALVEQPPWALREDGRPLGLEVALVEALASELRTEVTWVPASGPAAFAALDRGEVDLLVGGFTPDDPWTQKVAATRPYLVYDLVVAAPAGTAAPDDLDGRAVRVEPQSELAALVAAAGARPVAPDDPQTVLSAKPAWQLAAGEEIVALLGERRQVMLLPRGENAWLMTVDRFLRTQAGTAWRQLAAGAEP